MRTKAISAHGQLLFIFVKMCQKLLRRKNKLKMFYIFIGPTAMSHVAPSVPPSPPQTPQSSVAMCTENVNGETNLFAVKKRRNWDSRRKRRKEGNEERKTKRDRRASERQTVAYPFFLPISNSICHMREFPYIFISVSQNAKVSENFDRSQSN